MSRSASTGSIFERDVEHLDASLTAQDAIQLAVPPVLDEAIEALATLPPENILIDQIPLQYHLANTNLSPKVFHSTRTTSTTDPFSLNTSSSTPTTTLHHPPSNFTLYPFPLLLNNNNNNNNNHSLTQQPSDPPALCHQTMSCTSDTASISDPSSPRSLSPTPSYKIGRSMVTQLTDSDSIPILTTNCSPQPLITNQNKQQIPLLPSSLPNHHHPNNIKPNRERKTCISFMSYVDVLNSERADPSDSPLPPSNSAMNALRLARKSTSSLVKRASSIISTQRSNNKLKNNIRYNNSTTDTLGKPWVDRSRCNSSNTTYHSCPTQQHSIIDSSQTNSLKLGTNDSDPEILAIIDSN